ncbi:MAG: UvrB/UvrC motif-containing protein [Candidatus Sungbacteria bacterium]|uniref:UvrB/UvrC motif-containing protein n=1 Tax=Candidatus Sungiibacteriota bacterium TaxID=2750080 RepID=A0A9D6LTA5_9BACT|nr:UvrB/UvrC motif-containing protein [Candidatus Sungbacteria bacterium]
MLKKPKTIPTHPGVYIFKRKKTPLYVGKAANLKKRVSAYFKIPPAGGRGWKVSQLIQEATSIEFIKTASEIEALILESENIKKHLPKFNILMRDDKNYLYIAVTKDEFPRFYFTHQPEPGVTAVGPFVEATYLREAMRLLRGTFPYCSCKQLHRGVCVNAQIGRCAGYCCIKEQESTQTEKQEYKKNINSIFSILSGKRNNLLRDLEKEMKAAAKHEEYEKAAKLRNQIFGLESFYRHRGIALKKRSETPYFKIERVLKTFLNTKEPIRRIEGYDISNISGASSAGSMVVFYDGRPDKSQYRKFKIKTVAGANDVASHREVISRRLYHNEWELPDLIVIDGGKGQLNAILPLLNQKQFRKIHVSALSKPPRRFFSRAPSGAGQNQDLWYLSNRRESVPLRTLPMSVMHLLQRIRDESHRFAKSYHSVLRRKSFLTLH